MAKVLEGVYIVLIKACLRRMCVSAYNILPIQQEYQASDLAQGFHSFCVASNGKAPEIVATPDFVYHNACIFAWYFQSD